MTCVLSCFSSCSVCFIFFFFFNDTATTEIYTLSLHDALPILATSMFWFPAPAEPSPAVEEMLGAERKYLTANWTLWKRSEEHTSELQSRQYLVCRLLLEKKKTNQT